jgi:hypothetical protein
VEYAAGLIDGEGWIGITSRGRGETYEINLKVSMSDMGLPALRALEGVFGGKAIPDRDATDTRRPTWRWQLTGKKAAAALRMAAPHLLVKREQCRVALELMEMVEAAPMGRGGGTQWTPEMSQRAELLRQQIKHLNRRGPDPDLPKQTPLAVYRWGAWWEPEDDLFGPVEFRGKFPACGRMMAGHVYATTPWEQRTDGSASSSLRNLPTPTTRDWKYSQIRREPHRPDDTDTLSRALADLL